MRNATLRLGVFRPVTISLRKLGETFAKSASCRCVMSDASKYCDNVFMSALFAHSEQVVNKKVRNLRRDYCPGSRYVMGMETKIREIRKAKGWTVERLAQASGISKSYLSELETGKKQINGRKLEAIARALQCAPLDLLDDKTLEPDVMEHIRLLRCLSPSDRQAVIRHARGLAPESDTE